MKLASELDFSKAEKFLAGPNDPIDIKRFDHMKYILDMVKPREDSLIMEFGCWKGDSIKFIANHFKNNKVYGFDSFEGLPEQWASLAKSHFSLAGELPDVGDLTNIEFVKGWYCNTLSKFYEEHGGKHIAFIHIDCDVYSSTKEVLECFKKEILRDKPYILFDDFRNYHGWEKDGECRAFLEMEFDFEILSCTNYLEVGVKIL